MRRFIVSVVLVTMACLFYVFAEVQTFRIGYTIRKQEEIKTQLLDRHRALEYNIARLGSPANLEKRLAAQKVLLQSPKTWQTIVLDGQAARREPWVRPTWFHPSAFGRFFVGTAEAQAKESSN